VNREAANTNGLFPYNDNKVIRLPRDRCKGEGGVGVSVVPHYACIERRGLWQRFVKTGVAPVTRLFTARSLTKRRKGQADRSPKGRQRASGCTAILSPPYRDASSPRHGRAGPPASSACVNLNRERLRGGTPQGAAILYQNVDKGSQWSRP